ncbi:PAS domain S-box protein [Falsirhodobacter xinxiangensis]|uniref:PAS domain S-box protein n=1 Tax=Falsirhodobacter xinxiangensis TaxID=2530049 RepID=UPI0010AA9C8D|nr:PAS domain S-box protein [Rhodobacter xinxiangensis]
MIVTDRAGTITDWNTGAETIFGWTADEMRGSDASRFYTPEDRETDRAGLEMRRSLAEGSAVDERWHIRKDGVRFSALGKAHDVLMTGRKDAASVEEIVRSTVALLGEGARVAIAGPQVELGASAALSLALICHELATNASKYGALSVDAGQVTVQWQIETDAAGKPLFVFEWQESDGPVVTPPTRRGFGTRLIEVGLSGAFGAEARLDYAPSGLRCRLTGPLSELQSDRANNEPE